MIQANIDTERYRSGHNEAVLKTVCPQGHMGSNPILSAWRLSQLKRIRKNSFLHVMLLIFEEVALRKHNVKYVRSRLLGYADKHKQTRMRHLVCR